MIRENVLNLYKKTAKNFMTPEVVDYKIQLNEVVELSKGKDLNGKIIYGVSVLEAHDDYMSSKGNGQLFQGKEAYQKARAFYNSL